MPVIEQKTTNKNKVDFDLNRLDKSKTTIFSKYPFFIMFPLYTVATGNANKVIDLSAGATFVFNFKAKAGAAPASYDFTIEATYFCKLF